MIKEKITEGFYGCYWPYDGACTALIAMLGDARTGSPPPYESLKRVL